MGRHASRTGCCWPTHTPPPTPLAQPGYVPPGLKGVLPLAGDEASLELGVSPVAFQPGRPAGVVHA